KQNLLNAFDELTGIMLTTGVLKSATIEKTKDGKDYKAVFQKVARVALEENGPDTRFVAVTPVVINDYSKRTPLTTEAEKLVRYFHKTFHEVDTHVLQSKEVSQALSLISQHGPEACQHIIDFARAEAKKTNYPIQHFGAVINYASRAMADKNRK